MATIPPALVVESTPMIPVGRVALKRRGKIVWFGKLSDPWDDAEFDALLVSPCDYVRIAERFEEPK